MIIWIYVIKTKALKNVFLNVKISDGVFIKLINVKMPIIVEHEKSYKTLGPGISCNPPGTPCSGRRHA